MRAHIIPGGFVCWHEGRALFRKGPVTSLIEHPTPPQLNLQAHQETEKQAGKEAWDAEPAVGEADGEDHTLE